MCEKEIKKLGWKLVKKYKHDDFKTHRYNLGCMDIEFTYLKRKLVTCDVTIEEINCLPVNLQQVQLLTELIGKWNNKIVK